jgi:hypothetical protein
MGSITAVELGTDTCAFARTSVRRGEVRLSAAEILDPAAFPGIDAFTVAVRQTRRALRLPRRCRAVIWGLPDGANRKDAAVKPLLEPLTGAGFKVERVVSPCNALAALARLKSSRGEGSTCWIAINRGGVAIVVVRPGKQLYAHSFAWDSSIGASGSQARLLQRYSLVSFLSPEVKRAMAEARKYGTPVDAVVTCGNLPELRSLTMPLIEELDVEVETLDSLDGLVVKPQAAEKLAEAAPAIRLACAAAIARGTRPWDDSKRRSRSRSTGAYLRAAAIAAGVVGISYAWYVKTLPPAQLPPAVSVTAKRPESNPPAVSVPAPAPKSIVPPASVPLPTPKSASPAVSVPAKRAESNPHAKRPALETPRPSPRPPSNNSAKPASTVSVPPVSAAAKRTESNPPPVVNAANSVPRTRVNPLLSVPSPNIAAPSVPRAATTANTPAVRAPAPPPPAVSVAAKKPEPNPPAVSVPAKRTESNPPAVSVPAKKAESNPPAVSVPAKRTESNPRASSTGLNLPVVPADKPEAGVAARVSSPGAAGSLKGPMPPLLKDAVPRVTAILVSRDRRFATVDGGQIIGIGDLLGRRTVVGMDERSVLLQEPSGVQIRIGLGGRLLAVERAAR